jgi:membrane protein involved in colicin uptake
MSPEERWQKIENGMQFLLEQQARADARREADAAKHEADAAKHEAAAAKHEADAAKHRAEMDEIRGILRRAIRLSVQEARNERRKRREGDESLRQTMDELAAAQKATEQSLRAFIDSLRRGGNGHGG